MDAVIIDVEASGLHPESYPIQIAWVTLDGSAQDCFYIRPADYWTYWDEIAEEVHGITRGRLLDEGLTVTAACNRLSDVLAGRKLYSDAPDFDQFWLHVAFESVAMIKPFGQVQDMTELVQPERREALRVALDLQPRSHDALDDATMIAAAITSRQLK